MLGITIIRPSLALSLAGAAICVAVAAVSLAGCAGERPAVRAAELLRDLARAGRLDPAAAQSMISGYRGNNGLGAVVIDPSLMRSRTRSIRDGGARQARPRRRQGLQPAHPRRALRRQGAVENVSAGYHTLAEAFSGWRDSPPHRANMLNKGVTRMGIAAVYSPKSKYKVFWTLILAAMRCRARA